MLKGKKYFLFDIDGTLAVGETLYDGTKEFLEWIEKMAARVSILQTILLRAGKTMWTNLRDGALTLRSSSL